MTSHAPKRIQLRRTKGWRKPEGAIVVSRPSRYGNPYVVGDLLNGGNMSPEEVVEHFRRALLDGRLQFGVREVQAMLRGRDLACWCPLDQPCHADVLLEVANR